KLEWRYRYPKAQAYFSKTSVSEMKRRQLAEALAGEEQAAAPLGGAGRDSLLAAGKGLEGIGFSKSLLRRPRFMGEQKLTAAERGTLYHAVMQHLPVQLAADEAGVREEIARLAARGLLPQAQLHEIDPA